jgi:hypothetical protein
MSRARNHAKGKLWRQDETVGWQLEDDFDQWAAEEKKSAETAWDNLPGRGTTDREWRWMMWMWARRVRRDILILEEYLREQKAAGMLTEDPPVFGDPGDPPPPPEEDFA